MEKLRVGIWSYDNRCFNTHFVDTVEEAHQLVKEQVQPAHIHCIVEEDKIIYLHGQETDRGS